MRFAFDMCDHSICSAGREVIYIISNCEAVYRICAANISNGHSPYIDRPAAISMEPNKNQLREETIDFAIAVSDVCDNIRGCSVFVNQLLRCSSSIGANVHEAKYAQSCADFINKLEIALKESTETDYWLELLYRKKKLSHDCFWSLKNRCGTIRRKLIASVTIAKANGGIFREKA